VSSRDSRSPRRDRSKSRSKSPHRESSSGGALYIACLATVTDESEIKKRFSKYGKVLECTLVRDPRTKDSRGFGFVTMETDEGATACIENLHDTEIDGHKITVEKARRNRPRSPTPGKYLGSDRARTARARPPPPSYSYGGGSYRSGGGGGGNRYNAAAAAAAAYAPYYGYGYPYPPASYGRPSYPVYPTARYPERYQPYNRRDRSPPPRAGRDRTDRDRYSPYRGRGEARESSPYYSGARDRSRSRSRERHYL